MEGKAVPNIRYALFLESRGLAPIPANVNVHDGAKHYDYQAWIGQKARQAGEEDQPFMGRHFGIADHNAFNDWLMREVRG